MLSTTDQVFLEEPLELVPPPDQPLSPPPDGAGGVAFESILTVHVALTPPIVAVIVVSPAFLAVMLPSLSIDAIEESLDDQETAFSVASLGIGTAVNLNASPTYVVFTIHDPPSITLVSPFLI